MGLGFRVWGLGFRDENLMLSKDSLRFLALRTVYLLRFLKGLRRCTGLGF